MKRNSCVFHSLHSILRMLWQSLLNLYESQLNRYNQSEIVDAWHKIWKKNNNNLLKWPKIYATYGLKCFAYQLALLMLSWNLFHYAITMSTYQNIKENRTIGYFLCPTYLLQLQRKLNGQEIAQTHRKRNATGELAIVKMVLREQDMQNKV